MKHMNDEDVKAKKKRDLIQNLKDIDKEFSVLIMFIMFLQYVACLICQCQGKVISYACTLMMKLLNRIFYKEQARWILN